MRKIISIVVVLSLVLCFGTSIAEQTASADPVKLTIFFTNDTNAQYDHTTGMGYAMAASYINASRSENNTVFLFDAGNSLFPAEPAASDFSCEKITTIMNALRYDAMVPGVNDFTNGLLSQNSLSFPIIAANLITADNESVFEPYVILEAADKKIAVVGVLNPDLAEQFGTESGISIDTLENVEKTVYSLRREADAIILLAYWGKTETTSIQALTEMEGVSLIIAGGLGASLYEITQNDDPTKPLIVSADADLRSIGRIVIEFADDSLHVSAQLLPDPGFYEDFSILQLIDSLKETEVSE